MSTPAHFANAKPSIDPSNVVVLLIDHQSGLFQTVQDMPMPAPPPSPGWRRWPAFR